LGLTIRVVGQTAKRGITHRVPPADRLVADAQRWIGAEYGDIVRSMRCEQAPSGEVELLLDLHPAADTVTIAVGEAGRVVASADTSAVGPGYHTFVGRVLERLGEALDVAWSGDDEPAGAAQDGAAKGAPHVRRTPLAERSGVERAHLAVLGRTLGRALELRRDGITGIQVGTRPGTRYAFDGAIATPVGPRDDAWLEQAAREGRVAIDVRPWWMDATDARYLLGRALCLMWTEVRWRQPADDEERAVFDEALRLLRRALPMDPSLPYPWREWHELMTLSEVDDPMEHRVAPRAERADPSVPPIGYRRRPVTILHEGWALEVPGSFAERRTAEEWWGGERGRGVTLAGVETGSDAGPMRPDAFLARVAGDLGDPVLNHRDGDLVGKARLGTDASSGVEVAVLEGYSAVPGRGAAIRIVFEDADDWRWAVDLWRALRPA
jgi:hypothetical protein